MRNNSRPGSNNLIPLLLIGIGFLLVAGVLIWVLVSQNQASSPTTNPNANIPYPEIKRLTLADAKGAFDSKAAIFLDLRDAETFKTGHVPGAVNIPLALLENRIAELDSTQWIVTYCT